MKRYSVPIFATDAVLTGDGSSDRQTRECGLTIEVCVMKTDECEKLARRVESMAAQGLVDVKFFVKDLDGATPQQVCAEINAIYDAVERGNCRPLEFNDSHSGDRKVAAA